MTNPNKSTIPGMGAMTDTIDFMKNLWGGMGMQGVSGMKIPGMVMPTLSVDEINKQIKDLKSVENWLTMNLSMLRGTIQALEVQSATISTIQAMGTTLATAMKPGADAASKPEAKKKSEFESPFAKPEAAPEEEPVEAEPKTASKSNAKSTEAADPLIPPMANPAAWWGVLQDQFKQAVDTAAAMTPDMPAAAAKSAAKPEQPAKPKAGKSAKDEPAKKSAKAPAKRNS